MITVILTIHALIVLGLIVIVLLQRSEGGALGMGGGGGGFMTGRGAANVLTRTTTALAFMFFATSLTLGILGKTGESDITVIEELTGEQLRDDSTPASADDLLRRLGGAGTSVPPASGEPQGEAVDLAPEPPPESLPDPAPAPVTDETLQPDPEPAGDTEPPSQ